LEVDPRTGQRVGDAFTDFPRGTNAEFWSPTEPTLFSFDISLNWQLSQFVLLRRYDLRSGREDVYQLPRVAERAFYSRDLQTAVTVERSGSRSTAFLFDLATSQGTELFSSESRIWSARLSDDSTRVAFLETASVLGERGSVGVAEVANGSVRMLYDGAKLEEPHWSPNGLELAVADRPCMRILKVESGEAETLACYEQPSDQDAGVRTFSPHWSPDGTMLVWGALNPALRRHEIWVIERSTGAHRLIWAGEENYKTEASQPRWSPDGRFVAFTLVDNPPVEVWRLRHPLLTQSDLAISD
jgi:Tol biopolymer transport system component